MKFTSFRPIRPGDQLDSRPHNKSFRAIEDFDRRGVAGDLYNTGNATVAEPLRRIRARITVVGTGAQAAWYAWQKIQGVDTGGWQDDPTDSGSLPSGSAAPTLGTTAAYEENATTTVPVGRKVDLEWNGQAGHWRFSSDAC